MRKLIISLTIVLPGLSVPANVLTPDQALQRMSAIGRSKSSAVFSTRPSSYKLVGMAEGKTGPTSYIFNCPENGYVILSADDNVCPILGYAEKGNIDAMDIPCGLTAWLDTYSRQIDEVREAGMSNPQAVESRADDRQPLAPALTTQWGQSTPYNKMCPIVGEKQCVTGCVATAMAQVLNYYQYPLHGRGSYSYQWDKWENDEIVHEELSMDFSNTIFDWTNMLDRYDENYTDKESDAVAQLMYACGVAVKMGYGPGESGAVSGFVPYSLWQFFDYDAKAQYIQRDCWKEEGKKWDDFIYEQLLEHGAILYNGVTSANEGHAFVCDGYSGDGYFHFNWGWNGMSDGWFRLDALNPEHQGTGGSSTALAFNYNQSIVAFLDREDKGGEFLPSISGRDENFNVTNSNVSLGGKFTVTGWLVNESQLDYDIDFGCLLTDSEYGTEGEVIPVFSFELKSCEAKSIFKKGQFPSDIADGFYCMRPVITWAGLGRWWTVPWNVKKDHVWVEVKDGTAYFNVTPELSGIGEISEEDSSLPRYINLQGLSVKDPQAGETYIRIDKSGAAKVIF